MLSSLASIIRRGQFFPLPNRCVYTHHKGKYLWWSMTSRELTLHRPTREFRETIEGQLQGTMRNWKLMCNVYGGERKKKACLRSLSQNLTLTLNRIRSKFSQRVFPLAASQHVHVLHYVVQVHIPRASIYLYFLLYNFLTLVFAVPRYLSSTVLCNNLASCYQIYNTTGNSDGPSMPILVDLLQLEQTTAVGSY